MKNFEPAPKSIQTIALCFAITIILSFTCMSQEVLRLGDGEVPGRGSLQDLEWLVGYWKGSGLGGECDEVWMPAVDNSMSGIFRIWREGKILFTEYIVIEEKEGSLSIRLKHYNRDLSPWEEKDQWVEFKLVKIEEQTAWFDGLTYHRDGDDLTIQLAMRREERSWIEEFTFTGVGIPPQPVDAVFDEKLAAELGADRYGMRRYVMAFLKTGPNRDHDPETAREIQRGHMANINRLASEGKLIIAGPFLDGGEMRGIFIFNVETVEEAYELILTDPAVKAGRLTMELHPWYGSAALMKTTEIHTRISREMP